MTKITPFLSHAEILRIIAVALGSKKPIAKKLDDIIGKQACIALVDMEQLLDDIVVKHLELLTTRQTANTVRPVVLEYLLKYNELVNNIDTDGLTREELIRLLAKYVLPEFWNKLLFQLHGHLTLPHELLTHMCSRENSALQLASEWIGKDFFSGESGWYEHCRKTLDEKDKDTPWIDYHLCSDYLKHTEQSLPSQESIDELFPQPAGTENIDKSRLLPVLTLARVLEYVKRKEFGEASLDLAFSRSFGNTEPPFKAFYDAVADERRATILNRAKIEVVYGKLKRILTLDVAKEKDHRKQACALLEEAETLYKTSNSTVQPLADKSHFYWARYHVFSGELEQAVAAYGRAFTEALYRDGPLTKTIIKEGYSVAARHNGTGTKPLLRSLRKTATLLQLDGVGKPNVKPDSKKMEDFIADWEIEIWALEFDQIFNEENIFPGFEFQTLNSQPWFIKSKTQGSRTTDPRNPNAKKKYGEGLTKTTPKLIESIESDNKEYFDKLIKNGANANTKDSYGKTPLIESLRQLNPVLYAQNNKTCHYFQALEKFPHDLDTLLAYCGMYRSTALSSAIDTGHVDTVKKVLKLIKSGPKHDEQLKTLVNQKNIHTRDSDDCQPYPPLTYTLRLILGVKLPDSRTAIQQASAKHYDLRQLRDIARLLIESGSCFGQEPSDQNISPFWFAIETNEREVLKVMLDHGADHNAQRHNFHTGKTVNAVHYARHSKATACLEVLMSAISER